MKLYVLAILLMLGMVGAAELDAVLISTQSLAGSNCREQGGPTFYEVSAAIMNPSIATAMRITYEYYNSSSGDYQDGGKVCDVKPGMREPCDFRIYTITGGQNETEAIPFKVIGDYGNVRYEKELEVTITHYPGAYEQNIMNKLEIAKSDYERVSKKYTDCYNTSGFALMQSAYPKISDAEDKLSVCDIQGAQNSVNDAINKIREADGYARPASCDATPQNNTQPPQPPSQQNQTPQNNTTFNQTPPTTPPATPNTTSNFTNITSAITKACIPVVILLALFAAAVWSERKLC